MYKDLIRTLYLFSLSDQIEMMLFILRYISCLFLFVLGLKAPGIMQTVDYFSLNDSSNNITSQVRLNCVVLRYYSTLTNLNVTFFKFYDVVAESSIKIIPVYFMFEN